MISIGILCLIYLVCSLRTNVCYVIVFFTLVNAFGLMAAYFFYVREGNLATSAKLLVVRPTKFLLLSLLAAVDIPFQLPVGDLSEIVTYSKRNKGKAS